MQLDKTYANAFYAMGCLYQARNETEQALSNYEKYLSLEPSGPYASNVKEAIEKIRPSTAPTTAPETAGETTSGAPL